MSSSKIVIKNSLVGTLAQICSMIIGFITQRFFLRYLGLEISGINSVIGETLGFLAFAELGVGTAITYRLYKPLAHNDRRELTILMQLYKKLYQIIGIVVFVLGMALMLFLPVFINDASRSMRFIKSAYFIQLFSTSSTYFFAYKRSLIYADQKQFVCKIVDITCNILFSLLRIIILVTVHNFHLYLLVQFIQSLTANIILACYCNKNYGYVRQKTEDRFEDVKGMFKDTKDVLLGKVAGYVYSSTDNLVISTFSGIVLAGGFSNYKYVTNAVKNLVYSMTDSITATIGNNIQLKDLDQSYQMFRRYSFIRYVVANIACTGLCICTDAFVGFAFGTQYIMDTSILYLIVIDIFIGMVYGPLGEYVTVLGYFHYEKYINMIGAAINIGLSILLVQALGVQGVLIGTCVSQVFFWIAKSVLLCWKYFESWDRFKEMWFNYMKYILLIIGQVMILNTLKQVVFFKQYNLSSFLVEGICCVIVPVIAISVVFYNSNEYKYLICIIKNILKKEKV